ncbi:hypothetical protein [Sessilibacter corallicola]|uniref:Uncharacterized protein n=1 Tax=Sessilibacter corallicola TaxID=2904075 RepID=A0ABQ0AF94_9GAMM
MTLPVTIAKVTEDRFFGPERELKRGTKHFRGGAKVYVIDAYWGSCDSATVVGHHRASGRYIKIDMLVKHLTDFRFGVVYSPTVVNFIREHFADREPYTKEYGQSILTVLPEWKAMWS